jgi:hypothetical protein
VAAVVWMNASSGYQSAVHGDKPRGAGSSKITQAIVGKQFFRFFCSVRVGILMM